jgi:CxxC motif-containing protein (DUF1111 family)/beta-glucanase (GH16 family)
MKNVFYAQSPPVLRLVALVALLYMPLVAQGDVTQPVIGNLLFEERFEQLDSARWNPGEGNGCHLGPNLCGWGNEELQWYSPNNLSTQELPNEPGTHVLVMEARNETVDGNAFTSGKIDSKGKIEVQYGMIEYRVKVPDLDTGLWPAVWLLGSVNEEWPANGEIDLMEMGHKAQARADAGHPNAPINNYVGANAIFYSEDACSEGNPTCAAGTAWGTDNAYVSTNPLAGRFVTYRAYWTDTQLRFTVFDGGVEHDMYDQPIDISNIDTFQAPFYFLMNMAVGGNFTDALVNSEVTAPLPAQMQVDYLRVYELNGMGSVTLGGGSSSSSSSSSSSEPAGGQLEAVEMTSLSNGSMHFSIRLPEQKDEVHLFTRRNGVQDYVVHDLQNQSGQDNGDGTFTYQITRIGAYSEGDTVEARFYTFTPASGQVHYPGPNDSVFESTVYTEGGSSSSSSSESSSSSSDSSSSSSSSSASQLEEVNLEMLAGGSVRFSIRLPEQKDQVHLFARRNGSQDYVINDLQGVPGAEINNGDGTFTYQITREGAYNEGDLVEARFYTFTPASGQVYYPGPGDSTFTSATYSESASSSSSSSESSSSSSESSSSSSESSSSSSSSSDPGAQLEEVRIEVLGGGSVRFSIRLPEQKDQVHLFARRNNEQDYVINDLQGIPGAEIDNGDGTYTYQIERTGAYNQGDLIEARFYTFTPSSGQVHYPGPSDATFVGIVYDESSSSSSSESSSSSSESSSSSSESSSSSSESSSSSSESSSSSSSSSSVPLGPVVPLYDQNTDLAPVIKYDRGDALVTRFADRVRDRHAKEDHFQSYDHWLSFYWEHRTATVEIIDYVAKGGDTVRMNVTTQWRLNDTEAENRWFYRGIGTVAEYCDNGVMEVEVEDTAAGVYKYYKERSHNCREGRAIQIGDKMEFEISQFLDHSVPNGRAPYYGTTYLYIVGEGLVPWNVEDGSFSTPMFSGGIKDSYKIPESAWLGGETTIHADTSNEPHNRFMQMATNLSADHGQIFVEGRRIHHTSFVTGIHDELPHENPPFTELAGMAGPRYIAESCTDCHVRNGRAAPEALGVPLTQWVFKVGDEYGNPHPDIGRVLQPETVGGAASEGTVAITQWIESNGLRSPEYTFSDVTPETFSARITPQLVGLGLLEAIPEEAIVAQEDPDDLTGNGISGRAHRVIDPETGETRIGRFGWKAGQASLRHQIAGAFNNDMGVMTSVFPTPDCGANQTDCTAGPQLSDEYLDKLVKYVALLGVPPQRDYDDPQVQQGEVVFGEIGCASCHTPSYQTSPYHPLAELRNQTIYPYTDLLLHDMGPGLADSLGEGEASGSEWRTAPLWGLGHSACVTGGMPPGPQGERVCTPEASYLHDGRARTIEEAILWHGGSGQAANDAYQALSSADQAALLRFLESL